MKRFIAALLSVIMIVSLCACGKTEKTDGEKITLTIGLPNGENLTPLEIVEEFKTAHPEINVVTEEVSWGDFNQKLRMQIASSTPPDVFFTDSGYTATLGALGAALDLSDRIEKDLNKDEYISALYSGKDIATGKVYGIPHGLNSVAILYNEEIFDENNIPYPTEDWTYEDMLNIGEKLTKDENGDGQPEIYGLLTGWSIGTGYLPFVLATGGTLLNEDRTKSEFLNPKTVEGFRKFASLRERNITPPIEWISSKGTQTSAFYTGSVAMLLCQVTALRDINDNAPEGFRYNAQMLPLGWDGNRHCIYVPNQWVISSKSAPEVQDAAWEWLKFYLSEEIQTKLAEKVKGGFPINKKALEYCDSYKGKPENRSAFYKGIEEYGTTLSENSTYAEWVALVLNSSTDLYNGVITVEEAVKRMDADVTKTLSEAP